MNSIKTNTKVLIYVSTIAVLLSFFSGCASYEREEYYESGQLKEREQARGMSVRPR